MADLLRRRRRPLDNQLVLALASGVALTLVGIALSDVGVPQMNGLVSSAVLSLDPLAGRPGGPFFREPAPVQPGRLCVAGLPAGTLVRLDGRAVPLPGQGSGAIEVAPGAHRVEIRFKDGAAWATRLEVEPGGQADVRPDLSGEVALEAAPGAPAGVLFLDGERIGPAPAVLDSVPAGVHRVTLFSDGMVRWETEITVRAGMVTPVQVPGNGGRESRPGPPATLPGVEPPPPIPPES